MKKTIPSLIILFILILGCQQEKAIVPIKPFHSNDFIKVLFPFGFKKQIPISISRRKPREGIVYQVENNAPILSILSGKVIEHGGKDMSGDGFFITMDHGNKIIVKYHHLGEIKVTENQFVEKGDTIAISGNSGFTFVNSIGIKIQQDLTFIDPALFFNQPSKFFDLLRIR